MCKTGRTTGTTTGNMSTMPRRVFWYEHGGIETDEWEAISKNGVFALSGDEGPWGFDGFRE